MSYILEALKKAEAERQQGAVPTLYAQPAAALPADMSSPDGRRYLVLLVSGILLVGLGMLAWLRPWQSVPADAMPTSRASVSAPPAVVPPNPPPAAAVVAVAPAPEPSTALVKAKPKAVPPVTVAETAPRAAEATLSKAPAPNPSPMPQATSLTQTAGTPPGDLPSLTLGGYIYSETPSERQLLVNKRLMHEGEEVMPGLVLEKMLPKAAVFNYRGYRYQIAY